MSDLGRDADTPDLGLHLRATYERWFAEIGGDDWSWFDRTLRDDWVYVDYHGVVRTKADYRGYIEPVRSVEPLNVLEELDVRRFGDVAVVHGRYVVDDAYAPPGGGDTRFTAVWVHDADAGWRAAAHHSTTVRDRD